MATETTAQRKAREAEEAAAAAAAQAADTQADDTQDPLEGYQGDGSAEDLALLQGANPELDAEPESTGPAPSDPTLAELRQAADLAVTSAEALYFSGAGDKAAVLAAQAERAALRRR